MRSVSWSCHFRTLLHIFCSSLRKDGAACVPLRLGLCGLCGSIALLCRRVPWYGRYSFALIWNWIRGAGEGGRDDEEYQSFCLLCEVICGSTESAIMKVHLFTTEGLWVNLLSPRCGTWKNGSKSSAEEVLSIQFWPLLTSAHTDTAPALAGVRRRLLCPVLSSPISAIIVAVMRFQVSDLKDALLHFSVLFLLSGAHRYVFSPPPCLLYSVGEWSPLYLRKGFDNITAELPSLLYQY